jgi:hypothetical protein
MPGPQRTHIVLVPGFVGFDALGQLRYYEGLTKLFDKWRCTAQRRSVSLHYFDNFPTAAVELRAERLRTFLAKRIVRGEFEADDRIALVGHSTGGLDIRKLMVELATDPDPFIHTDTECPLAKEKLLACVERIGFLSVPHYGTNLADIACRARVPFRLLFKNAALAVALNREPLSEFSRYFLRHFGDSRSDLLLALADVISESDEDHGGSLRQKTGERQARSELGLWLSHMSRDFRIIHDLRSHTGHISNSTSPAHFCSDQRNEELRLFRERIKTLSFATIVPQAKIPISPAGRRWAHALRVSSRAPAWTLGTALAPVALGVLGALHQSPGLFFDICRAFCADETGSFKNPDDVESGSIAPTVNDFSSDQVIASDSLEPTDSDGVVNTLSMLWPYDAREPNRHTIALVEADHEDIVGHYTRRLMPEPFSTGRRYASYDFFQSSFAMSETTFRLVWERMFDFCVS